MRQLGHDLPPVLRRPAAVLAAGLASVSLSGCFGGGDATLDFKAACAPSQTLRETGTHWFADHHLMYLDVACEDGAGHESSPLYLQEGVVSDIKPIKPDFDMTVHVNGRGHWYTPIQGYPSASYGAFPYDQFTGAGKITLDGIDRVESVKITKVGP